jgi:DNA-binding IscR family transcriptional regulator
MVRFFKQHDLHTILVPDVLAAQDGLITSVRGAQGGIKQSTNEVRLLRKAARVQVSKLVTMLVFKSLAVESSTAGHSPAQCVLPCLCGSLLTLMFLPAPSLPSL